MVKLRYILLTLCIIGCNFGKCQNYNLISNPSFENFTNLHNQSYEGMFEAYTPTLVHILNDWERIYSSDHYDTSFSQGTFGIPYNTVGNSYPKHGHAYVGAICFANNGGREYIFQHLSNVLKTDSVYCLSFFVSRADRITHAIKNIGAYFSSTAPPQTLPLGYINTIPQITNVNGFITDTVGWTEIQGCFTAQGGEQYVTIGNFESNTNTDTLFVGSTNPISFADGYGYYYIDSVSLWQNNFPTFVKEDLKAELVSVYPNPASSVISINLAESIAGVEAYQIKITDVLGREVMVSEFKEQLHISQLETGIYFLSLYKSKTLIGTKKIVRE